jgi:ABC-type dipeptide/oligopeptide/nickel transport system permease subunit
VGAVILIESALSYPGLGISPPTPSWGPTCLRRLRMTWREGRG